MENSHFSMGICNKMIQDAVSMGINHSFQYRVQWLQYYSTCFENNRSLIIIPELGIPVTQRVITTL